MPVHLFGRPAPLDELAALGLPIVEDAAQAFGSPRSRRHGVASTFSFYPTKNLFAFGDGGLVAVADEELGERVRLLRFHGSRAKKDFELVGLQLAPRRAAGSVPARVPAEARRVERASGARPPSGTARSGSATSSRFPRTSPATSTTCSSAARRSATGSAPRSARREIGNAQYYLPPLHLQPSLRYLGWSDGDLPETERAARENFSVPLWAGIDEATQERVVSVVREAVSSGRRADLAADQPAPPLAARRRRVPVRGRLVPRLPAPLRPEGPALLPHALRPDDLVRDPDPDGCLRPLRVLQPLVALRLHARHVGRRARRHRRVPHLQPRRLLRRPGQRRCGCRARSR